MSEDLYDDEEEGDEGEVEERIPREREKTI